MERRRGATRVRGRLVHRAAVVLVTALAVLLGGAGDARAEVDDRDRAALDTPDLFDLEVTSLSNESRRCDEAPAAIYVIRGDDIGMPVESVALAFVARNSPRRSTRSGSTSPATWEPAFPEPSMER